MILLHLLLAAAFGIIGWLHFRVNRLDSELSSSRKFNLDALTLIKGLQSTLDAVKEDTKNDRVLKDSTLKKVRKTNKKK